MSVWRLKSPLFRKGPHGRRPAYNLANQLRQDSRDENRSRLRGQTRLSELLAAVELGEEVTITRRGRPVARIVAAVESPRLP
jgi:prevent-host-death family protein